MPRDHDRSDARQAPARADASELRAVLDRLPLATAIRDRQGRFLYANAAAAPGYGVTVDEMIGRREQDLLPEGNDLEDVLSLDREVIESGRTSTAPGQSFRTHEGRQMVLHITREAVTFGGEPAVMVTAMDVTGANFAVHERMEIERRMAASQRLEGLGLMAGGIAHDFNNLLVGVMANTELALGEVSRESRAGVLLGRVASAARRLSELSGQILAYAGHGPVDIHRIDVPNLVREMLELLRVNIPPLIRVETSLAAGLPEVDGDRAQLNQVVMNLVTNAAQAIGGAAGTIHVAARSEYLDTVRTASLAVRSPRGPGDYLCLEVRDDGPGMDAATRDRIFDPFFTTKGPSGHGLGLASVIGIVRAHRGALQVDSQPGAGTRFRLWLPLTGGATRQSRRTRHATTPVSDSAPSTLRVLVVDDEAMVRQATGALLEAHGFDIELAEDSNDALRILERLGPVDAVLLDMTMPGRAADAAVALLREQDPGLPILLTSGFSEPEALARLLSEPATAFIQKPFATAELIEQLRSLAP